MKTKTVNSDGALYRYQRFGLRFVVWPDRIVVEKRRLFSWVRDSIPLLSVAEVERRGVSGHIRITTKGGKTHDWLIGRNADGARDAVVAAISNREQRA